ncbi:DUF982 domain-containing protein [Mesorhizobium sp. Mes31]|uniref:DUF982 domain-containing protein n=1 Tax=Mesorhizobium sp. Mes31 TaxID=2926017 RepID=UPI00211736E8|nr:DUF982 domain-containing protein [Mesorhizobium sp. Mes31]
MRRRKPDDAERRTARECESPEHDATRHNARQLSGRKHVAARKACLGVLEGLKETREARKAFIEAAKEADILVEWDPFS